MALEISIWIYWFLCGLATTVLVANWKQIPPLLSPSLDSSASKKQDYFLALALGWGATLLAALGYVLLTRKDAIGSYQIQDLVVFSFLNGTLEQLMFIFWFLLGCYCAKKLDIQSPWKIFGLGFLSYSIYSGIIHGMFWVAILPSHQVVDAIVIRLGLLLIMSLTWMWLFWRHRAVTSIICMHILIDFITIGHLHFTWFDSYQLTALLSALGE